MRTIFLASSYLSRLSSRSTAFLVVICLIGCLTTRLLEDPELVEKTGSSLDQGSSTKKHCASSQQQQDDTTVLLQGGRIKVERLSESEFDEQIQQGEATLQVPPSNVESPLLPMSTFTASSISMSQTGESTTATVNPFKKLKTSMLSLLRKMPAFNATIEGSKGNVGAWLIVSMVLCTVFAACGVFVPAMFDTDEKKTYFRTNDHLRNPPRGEMSGPPLGSSRPPMSSAPRVASPLQTQHTPGMSSYGPQAGRSPQYDRRFGAPPSPMPTSQPYMPGMPIGSPLPSLASGLPTRQQDDISSSLSKRMPPPLCPTLVLPVCEARFGVPMFEIAQLTSEGELGIVGLSGNPLLRASVRKVGRRRALEISMPEAGSAPRATIGPNFQDVNRPDDGALEIRGLKGSFYGMLEMRASGACYVTKDSETMMIIDGDTDSLQLSIKSGGGMPLASVRCSTEPFGGVDHVEIRVEPGVDTVLVLACVLAVLLLSPTS